MNPALIMSGRKRAIVGPSYQSVVLGDGAQHLWMLNETSGTIATDLGSLPVNGTYTGTCTLNSPTGLTGIPFALSLSGSGYVVTGGSTFLTSSPTTVEGWVYQSSTNAGNFLAINFNNGIRLQINGATVNVIFNEAQITSSPISLNTWYHVVVVLTSGGITLYKNGVQVSTARGWPAQGGTYNTYIGQSGQNNEYLVGKTAGIALYPLALTPTQILNHYNAGK